MKAKAFVYSENEFGKIDGKVANGLARHSEKYDVLGIIDSSKKGLCLLYTSPSPRDPE